MPDRPRGSATGVRWIALGMCWIMLMALGCESPEPPSPIQKNIDTFALAERKVAVLRSRVTDTLIALHDYCNRPGGARFDAFVQAVDATESAGGELPDIFAVLDDQGGAYFLQWDRDIAGMTDPKLKADTTRQRSSAKTAFNQIEAQRPKLIAVYDTFIADLHNLRTFFGYNKSTVGIAEASQLIATTRADGAELLRQLDLHTTNLKTVRKVFIRMSRG